MLETRLALLANTNHFWRSLLEWMATEELHGSPTTAVTFDSLTAAQQETVRTDAEECIFLHQSGSQHEKLEVDLQSDFTTGKNHSLKPVNKRSICLTSVARQW